MNNMHKSFEHQKYLVLETFRRNGRGVKTPVWFVQDGDVIYIRTGASSGKVKRIRNNPEVNIAPCKMDGSLVGGWVAAMADEMKDEIINRRVDQLLNKKYGIIKKLFYLAVSVESSAYTILKVKVRN